MKAQYKGTICQKCKKEIEINQEIEKKNSSWAHVECIKPEAKPEEKKPEVKEPQAKSMTVKLVDPFQESELIISIVKNFAYKAVNHSRGITDISELKRHPEQFKQFEIDVMHTEKLFLECILRLRELHNIKSEYAKK